MLRLNEPFVDHGGRRWNSYRVYCKSDAPDFDVVCVMLETGRRTPQNEWERDYVKEARKYKERGIATELPFD